MNDNNQQPTQEFDWTKLLPLVGGIGAGIGLYNTTKGLGKPYQQAGDVLQNYFNQAQGQMGTYEGSFRDPVALQNQEMAAKLL